MLVFEWNFLGLSSETKPLNNEKVINGSTFYECDTSNFFIYYNGEWYKQTFVTDDGINVYLYKFLMHKMFKNAFDTNISKTHIYNPEISSNISFTSVLPSNITEMEMYGDTSQQTYSGKNLMPMAISDNTTSRVTNFKISLPAGTYTISFDISDIVLGSNQSFNISMTIAGAVSGGVNYDGIISGTISSTMATHKTFTFTTTEHSNASAVSNIRITQNYWDNGARAKLSNIQIEAGSEASSFEPYVGGVPAPNPEYPQDVHTVTGEQTVRIGGKNLWKPAPDGTSTQSGITSVRENGVITLTGTSTSTSVGTSNFYDLDTPFPAGTYTFSIPNPLPYRFEFVMQDSNGTNHFPSIPAGSTSGTITTTWETVKIRNGIGGYSVGTEINLTIEDLQLEAGSEVTTYQTYKSQSYPINLGSTELCKIGEYQDYIYKSGNDWYVHKAVGKITYTGDSSENWIYSSTSGGPFRIAIPNSKYYTSNNVAPLVYCDYYTPAIWNSITSYSYAVTAFNNNVLPFRNTDITSLDAWKAWLGSHNMTVYYPFATSSNTKIIDTELISSLNSIMSYTFPVGINSITVSASNLPALLKLTIIEKE